MKTGIRILEQTERTVRALISFHSKIEELRQEEARAEARGDFGGAMAAFTARMWIITGGSVNLALPPDPYDIMSKLFSNVVCAVESNAGVGLLESLFADATMQLEGVR